VISVITSVATWIRYWSHYWEHHWPLAVGPGAGVIGIMVAIIAHRRATRAVAECTALINGSVGSRGTVDPRALRDLAVVRYDALSEMSGQLSFSVALLNALGDGVVLSSINGRSETRTYAKVIRGGAGTQPLSPEEEHAVRAARLGQGVPDAEQAAAPDVTVRTWPPRRANPSPAS
jgi:Protein of unknown function (DUF4446)